MYEKIRKGAIIFFIVCMVATAIVVIFAIWGAFDRNVIGKSFGSLAILVVSSALIGITTLIREGKGFSNNTAQVAGVAGAPVPPTQISVGRVILYVILILFALPFIFSVINGLLR